MPKQRQDDLQNSISNILNRIFISYIDILFSIMSNVFYFIIVRSVYLKINADEGKESSCQNTQTDQHSSAFLK